MSTSIKRTVKTEVMWLLVLMSVRREYAAVHLKYELKILLSLFHHIISGSQANNNTNVHLNKNVFP